MSIIKIHRTPATIGIKDNIAFASNGNIVFGFKINYPEVFSMSEKNIDDLHSAWLSALKGLPSGTVVHKQDVYLKKEYAPTFKKESFLSKATADYFNGRKHLEHTGYLFFSKPLHDTLKNASLVNPFKRHKKTFYTDAEQKAEEFQQFVNESVNFMNHSRTLSLSPLTSDELKGLSYLYYNGFYQDMHVDVVFDENLKIGNKYAEIIAITNEHDFLNNISTVKTDDTLSTDDFTFHVEPLHEIALKLQSSHIINQIIYLDENSIWKKKLEKTRDAFFKMRAFGTDNKPLLEKIEATLEKIAKDETSRLVRGSTNIMVFDENKAEVRFAISKIQSAFKELDMIPTLLKSHRLHNCFLNNHFCFSSNLSNDDLYVVDLKASLCLFTATTNYKNDETGVILNDRISNIPVVKDIWDEKNKKIKARNFMIFAPTGEGKSFLANHILRQYYEDGVRLAIIDLGGSYTKLSLLYPKDTSIIRYKEGESLGVNPFFVKNKNEATSDFIEDLSDFVFELFGSEQREKATEVSVKKLLKHYYHTTENKYCLQSFYTFLTKGNDALLNKLEISSNHFPLHDFLHVLSPYVHKGSYAFLFEEDAKNDFSFTDKRILVFELDNVKDHKDLLAIMLKLIKTAITRTIWKNRSEKGIVLFDEFAKQLKFDNVLKSVEYYYQAIRKHNGAIGTIMQSIDQLPKDREANAMLDNTQIFYFLYNEKGYEALISRLRLSSQDKNQLKSIRSNRQGMRKYTEFYLKIANQGNVFRLEVPPEVFSAYLTDGKQYEQLLALFEKYGDMQLAIKGFVAGEVAATLPEKTSDTNPSTVLQIIPQAPINTPNDTKDQPATLPEKTSDTNPSVVLKKTPQAPINKTNGIPTTSVVHANDTKIYNTEQASKILNTTAKSIQRRCKKENIEKVGRRYQITDETLKRWSNQNKPQ